MHPLWLTHFTAMDALRQLQGEVLEAFGLGPAQSHYRVVSSGPHWRLRAYTTGRGWASVIIVAAPIKRPYIWDLTGELSAIRYCMRQRLCVYLLEWAPATRGRAAAGLDEYAGEAISECVAATAGLAHGEKPFLMGHSLGGTLAAIYASLHPRSLQGLVLLGAPLCFEPGVSRFGDALVSIVPPSALSSADVVPGSLLSQVSALASPGTFVSSRLLDAVLAIPDWNAQAVHARVERWALDEVALPGRLVHQIVEWLYREDRFCRGTLTIRDRPAAPSSLRLPTVAVVNAADEIAPPDSVTRFAEAMPEREMRIIAYPGEIGVGLQHLAVLVGRQAYARVWPEIVAWIGHTAERPGARYQAGR
jgi:polyhydroxyalkanoate synthase